MSEDYYRLDFGKICHKLSTGPKIPIEEINRKRNLIIERLNNMVKQEITLNNFERVMSPSVLNTLVNMYDELFFDNNIQKSLQDHGCVLTVCFNKRCLKVAGKCYYKKRCKLLEIHLSSKVFKNALTKRKVKVRINSGLECDSILSCMLITFEHEFVHGLLACFCYNLGHSNTYFRELYGNEDSKELFTGPSKPNNGHSNVFMTIVNKKFGHTKYLHDLLAHDSKVLINDPNFEFFLKDFNQFENWKKTLMRDDKIYFNAEDDVKECKLVKRLKNKLVCKDSTSTWTIPYQFLVRPKTKPKTPSPKVVKPKTPSPKVVKPKTPSPKIVKPKTPSPKVVKPTKKKKVKFVIKPKIINNSNNKPLPLKTKKKTDSNNNKPLPLKKSETKYDGPHENTYLAGLPKDYTKIYGRTKITDFEEAKSRCDSMGKESSGITQKGRFFSLRKGKTLKASPSGERSWIKKF